MGKGLTTKLRIVESEFYVEINKGQLDYILHEFYHFLHHMGFIYGDEPVVGCYSLVREFVEAQEWVSSE